MIENEDIQPEDDNTAALDFIRAAIDILHSNRDLIQKTNELSLDNLCKLFPNLEVLRSAVDEEYYKFLKSTWGRFLSGYFKNKTPLNEVIEAVLEKLADWTESLPQPPIKIRPQVDILNEQLIVLTEQLYLYDAIYDLLSGNLHLLDPVIGDFGCQWRVPFIIDTHDAIMTYLPMHTEIDLQTALDAYQVARNGITTVSQHLGSYRQLAIYYHGIDKVKGRLTVKDARDYNLMLTDGINYLKQQAAQFFAVVENSIAILNSEFERPQDQNFDPVHYLRLCKVFTANRTRTFDCFGLSGIQEEHLLPFPDLYKKIYARSIGEYSMTYMQYITSRVTTFEITEFGEPQDVYYLSQVSQNLISNSPYYTAQQTTMYQTQVFYGPCRTLFAYQYIKGQPIIIDIRRLICTPDTNDTNNAAYTLDGCDILYFEPSGNGQFTYVANPTLEQTLKVGMCIETFSIVRPDLAPNPNAMNNFLYVNSFDELKNILTGQVGIVDLFMFAASTHPELPKNISYTDTQNTIKISLESSDVNVHVDAYYKEHHHIVNSNMPVFQGYQYCLLDQSIPLIGGTTQITTLLRERNAFRDMWLHYNIDDVKYKDYEEGRGNAIRTMDAIPFGAIHIYGCTYAVKRWQMDQMLNNGQDHSCNSRTITRDDCWTFDD